MSTAKHRLRAAATRLLIFRNWSAGLGPSGPTVSGFLQVSHP
jgi:hypothetical protein